MISTPGDHVAVRCTRCPVELVPAVWPLVSGWVHEAVTHGDGWWTAEELHRRCKLGQMGLWVLSDAEPCGFAITEIEEWDTKRVATVAACGGRDFDAWGHYLAEVEDWAREWGATEIQVRGRIGWQRKLRDFGYNPQMITLAKAL